MIPLIMLAQYIIYGNTSAVGINQFAQGYAYINTASGGTVSLVLFLMLYVVFVIVMLFRDTEIEVASLVSAVILALISVLAQGVYYGSATMGSPYGVFLFGGIAMISLMLVAFRGASKSY